MRFSAIFPAALLALSTLACGSAPEATQNQDREPTRTTRDPGLQRPTPTMVITVPKTDDADPCSKHPCPDDLECHEGEGVILCLTPPPADEPVETPPEPKPECVTDADCATHNDACLTFWCGGGSCFAKERDDDGDGRSLCGGGKPGSFDCDDNNAAIHPGAIDVCGDGIDNDCNGLVDDGCYEFCDTLGGPQNEGRHWERGCCALNGAFKAPAAEWPVHGEVFKAASSPYIYYLASSGERYIFPIAANFASWFGKSDANGVPSLDPSVCGLVTEYPDATVAKIAIAGNVGFRPMTFITGIHLYPERYVTWPATAADAAIGCGGIWRKAAPDVLEALFPADFGSRVILTPDPFVPGYCLGLPIDLGEKMPALNPPESGGIDQYLGLAPWSTK